MKPLAIIALVLVVLFGVFAAYNGAFSGGSHTATSTDQEAVACAQDVRECPDGTYVNRVAPSCEFKACPDTAANQSQSATVQLGVGANVFENTVVVLSVLEDSRCPAGVYCIQAGTVRVRAAVNSLNRDFTFVLGQPQTIGAYKITLTEVTPGKFQNVTIKPSDYRFTFTATKS